MTAAWIAPYHGDAQLRILRNRQLADAPFLSAQLSAFGIWAALCYANGKEFRMASPFNDFTPLKNGVADDVGVFRHLEDFGVYEASDDVAGEDRRTSSLEVLTYVLMMAIFVTIFAYGGFFR